VKGLQLKRLEAYGFKSFADKIEIEFDKGITAIVGPNGSGKSNITDAIRWVLGEQNIRNLRGLKSEDIIFAGSVSRRALGLAEVSLIFDNDGGLPVDFKEVAVTRRLFRSGESEFYINKTRCRLKDIYDLFADTGLGHDGMSIISQNKMDEILNSKPEERRLFFEETAGITKYRSRKRESVRKLEDTEHNLLRVTDIIHEIGNQLDALAANAEKTRRYNALQEEYKNCKLTGLYRKYEKFQAAEEKSRKLHEEYQDKELQAQTAVQLTEARKEALDKEQLEIEKALQLLAGKNSELRTKLENISSEIKVAGERKKQDDTLKTRLVEQRDGLIKEMAAAEEDVDKLGQEEASRRQQMNQAEALLTRENSKAAVLGKQIKLQKEECHKLEQDRQGKQQVLMEKQNALVLVERDIQDNVEHRGAREKEAEEVQGALASLQQEEVSVAADMQRAEQAKETLDKECQRIKQELRQLSERDNAFREQLLEMRQRSHVMENKLQFLQNMQKAYEGFGRAAKAVLKSREPWHSGICGAAAELIEVPQKYIMAIEIALGGSVQNVVTEDTETAQQAIAFLKRERAGRVTFLPLSSIVVHKPSAGQELREPGVLGYANDLVTCAAKYRKIADFLLGRTLVVDTLAHALSLAKKQGYRMRIVTLEGELLNPGGSLSGGSRQQKESGFLSRSGEIGTLEAGLDALRQKEPLLLDKQREVASQKGICEDGLHEKEDDFQQLGIRQAELRVAHAKLLKDISSRKEQLQAIEAMASSLQLSFAEAQKKRVETVHALHTLQEEYKGLTAKNDAAGEALEDMEQDAGDLAKYINDCSLKKVVLEQEVLRCHERRLLRQRELVRTQESLDKNGQEHRELANRLQTGYDKLLLLQQRAEECQTIYDEGIGQHKKLYEDKMAKLAESQENDKKTREAAGNLGRMQQKLHQIELEVSEVQFNLAQCCHTLQEEYGFSPEMAAGHVMELAAAALQEKMQKLQSELNGLGQVNPNAVTEYEEAQKRHDFMQRQAQDLITAKENLVNILHEMDVTMTKQFKSALTEIDGYFRGIFVKLFGGGNAELVLTDEKNVLEAGVEILVQLPDKKRQNLTALSGGERALTVIALLFSFLKYKPSPFSVLDEIDAPLDEANISRFCTLLRDFAKNTQFIIVTHRKGTMEAVDVMYGVTIQDAGVSQMVSVRLDEI
jgi:chromosome segregation protein